VQSLRQQSSRRDPRSDSTEVRAARRLPSPLPVRLWPNLVKLHPELFLAPDSWNFHDAPCDLHLTLDGILLGDQKVADAAQVVEQIARVDLQAGDWRSDTSNSEGESGSQPRPGHFEKEGKAATRSTNRRFTSTSARWER